MHNAAAQRTPLHAHANQFSVTRSLNFGLASFLFCSIKTKKSHVLKGQFSLVRCVHGSRGRGHRDPPLETHVTIWNQRLLNTWVKIFRINPEFRILRLTFHRKSTSKCRIMQIMTVSLISFQII